MPSSDRADLQQPQDIEGFDIAVRLSLVPRVIRETDRRRGDQPLALVEVGVWRQLRCVSKVIDDGESDVVYLTEDGRPRGQNVFAALPSVKVLRDDTNDRGGLVKASGPASSKNRMKVSPHEDYVLEWDPTDLVYLVTVNNTTGAKTSFLVEAGGV